jgi:hypothetical protein
MPGGISAWEHICLGAYLPGSISAWEFTSALGRDEISSSSSIGCLLAVQAAASIGEECPGGGGRPPSTDGSGGGSQSNPSALATAAASSSSELLRLELQLAELGPRLASLAIVLRSSVLPAMPWISVEGSERIQVMRCCSSSQMPPNPYDHNL